MAKLTAKNTLPIYQKAINKIDDYFEYMSESDKDKKKVRKVLAELSQDLVELVKQEDK